MASNGYVNNPQQNVQPQQAMPAGRTSMPVNYQQLRGQVAQPPQASTSAVNIQIVSPSVYGQGQSNGNIPPLYPYNPIYNYPPANNVNNFSPSINQTMPNTEVQTSPKPIKNSQVPSEPEKKVEKETEKKTIIPLTDNYIKTLENYLNNPNEQIRTSGVKQVLQRFKEDDSRKNDAALTALLNKALQDKSSNVRALAMTIPASGYASGNDKTVELLNKIQSSKSNYNEDAILASNALMKMAENSNKVEVEVTKESTR